MRLYMIILTRIIMSKLLESFSAAIQPKETMDAQAFLKQAAKISGLKMN